jgi:hypothetical protein
MTYLVFVYALLICYFKEMNSIYKLNSKDPISLQLRQKNIINWQDLTTKIKALPYGRNDNREDLEIVWKEQKGTCSSKHAFLKYVADLNSIPNVKLMLGIYKMNHVNTPKIGDVLIKKHLDYIPEALCYLK